MATTAENRISKPLMYGWFRTGDIGTVDPVAGHLVIRGRSKEMIINEAALIAHKDAAGRLQVPQAGAQAGGTALQPARQDRPQRARPRALKL